MMGRKRSGQGQFFYTFNLEDHVPQDHLPRGLAALFQRLSKTSPTVNIARAFEEGDFVFAHKEYDFASQKTGFDVFRFENGKVGEHWDTTEKIVPRSKWKNDSCKF